MLEPAEIQKKTNWRLIGIVTGIVLVAIIVIFFVALKVVENRIFSYISNQKGVTITIGARHGNLFSGYTLDQVSVKRPGESNAPATTFVTPKVTVKWKISGRPYLTRIAWDPGSYFLTSDQQEEEIPIGAGNLIPAPNPGDFGWLVSDKSIIIGPEEWSGTADLKIRVDGSQIDGKVNIDQMPSRYLSLATQIPSDFLPFGNVILEMKIEGSPQNLQASGQVTDPLTREAFKF